MVNVVTKKVRLSAKSERTLRRLARESRASESEILRRGIELVAEERNRAKGIEMLISLIDGPEPPKIRFRLK